MNLKQAIIAALRRDPDLLPKVTGSLKSKIDERNGPMSTVVQAAGVLEPVLRETFEKRPSRLSKLGFRSAHILAGLAAEDSRSGSRLARLAGGDHVGIVFVDVDGFTGFTAERGDEAAIELLSKLDGFVTSALKPTKGECVKKLGDGFLLAFPSASQAVRGAVILRDRVAREREGGFEAHLQIAVHAGEPSIEHDDLLGHDVNLTARLLDHCPPDEVIVSEAAKELAGRRLRKIAFVERRVVKIRGLTTPVAVYAVDPGERSMEKGDELRAGAT